MKSQLFGNSEQLQLIKGFTMDDERLKVNVSVHWYNRLIYIL